MKAGELSPSLRKRLKEAGALRVSVATVTGLPIPFKFTLGKSRQKYNARKVCIDGHVFQSQLEADYYLKMKPIHGDKLEVHPSVELVSRIRYKADFAFPEGDRKIYVDTKSDATKKGRFPTICKLWRDFGPGVLRVVYRGPRGTFITKREIHSKKITN